MDCSYCGALYPDHNAGCEAQSNAALSDGGSQPVDASIDAGSSRPELGSVSQPNPGHSDSAAPDAGDCGCPPTDCKHYADSNNCPRSKPPDAGDLVERFSLDYAGLESDPDGDWVRYQSAAATIAALRQQIAELNERISELTMHQSLQDAATAAVMERAEKAERDRDALRKDAELFRFVFSKPRKIDGVFDATFDEKTQKPAASFRSIDLTPIGREWDSDSDSLDRLRAAIATAMQAKEK